MRMMKRIMLVWIILFCFFYVLPAAAWDNYNVTPEQIMFTVDSQPAEDVPANHTIMVERKQSTDDIIYQCTPLTDRGYTLSPHYILVRTPYQQDFVPLDNPVLLLAAADQLAEFDFRLAREAWGTVPPGHYKGWLHPITEGPSIRVHVKIKGALSMSLSANDFNVYADHGPGLYPAEEEVNVQIFSACNCWQVAVETEPLQYQGDSDSVILPEDLWLSVDDPDGPYHSLDQIFYINGDDYGCSKDIHFDLYLKARIGLEHIAGLYSGDMILTVSQP